jgi:hypothetical protein
MGKPGYSRRIEVRVPSRDFADGVWTALERLGYEFMPAHARTQAPHVRIVLGGRLGRLSADATEPVILFGGWQSRDRDDPRVVGIVRPPARLLDLYVLLQNAVETHPRAVPRIPASLPARSLHGGVESPGAILSLSERGCLLRSVESLPGGGSLRLQFALPGEGLIHSWAKPCHQAGRETGLAFEGLAEYSRTVISEFVTRSLTQGL